MIFYYCMSDLTVLNKSWISYYPDQNQKAFNEFNLMGGQQADETL